jgi:hypothetical protein
MQRLTDVETPIERAEDATQPSAKSFMRVGLAILAVAAVVAVGIAVAAHSQESSLADTTRSGVGLGLRRSDSAGEPFTAFATCSDTDAPPSALSFVQPADNKLSLDSDSVFPKAFPAQRTSICPFLGTLLNEGLIRDDWMTFDRAFELMKALGLGHEVKGHFGGNFRGVPAWTVKHSDAGVAKAFWYMKADKMEGFPNEHRSSAGISDCPNNWDPFYCRTNKNNVWVCGCDGGATSGNCQKNVAPIGGGDSGTTCVAKLPNIEFFHRFWKETDQNNDDVMQTQELRDYKDRHTNMMMAKSCPQGDCTYTRGNNWHADLEAGPTYTLPLEKSQNDWHPWVTLPTDTATCSTHDSAATGWMKGADRVFSDVSGSDIATATNDAGDLLELATDPKGGPIGGGVAGGYMDLVKAMGEECTATSCCGGTYVKGEDQFCIKRKDLERIDLERRLPCSWTLERKMDLFASVGVEMYSTKRPSSNPDYKQFRATGGNSDCTAEKKDDY